MSPPPFPFTMHPNRSFDIYLTDSQLSVLSGFEVSQIADTTQGYLVLLKLGSASVLVVKSGNLGSRIGVRWANRQGYVMLGIPEQDEPPAKA